MSGNSRTSGATVAGRYVLDRLLGSGAFGQVWAAHDVKAFRRAVAIKFLLDEHLANADVVERFWREGQATAALAHPNVVALLEFGEDSGVPYLVSELVDGKSLRERLDDRDKHGKLLTADEALAIFQQVCAGVTAAHEKGIVHRDLKPENVLVQDSRESAVVHVKVLDFGIARILARDSKASSKTENGRVIGSLQYMAPEQILGEVSAVNERSDVFALGAILYELLTLRCAFDGDSFPAIAGKILQGPRPAATPLRPDLPPAVDVLFTRVFAQHPKDRFASVTELSRAAERCLREGRAPDETAGQRAQAASVTSTAGVSKWAAPGGNVATLVEDGAPSSSPPAAGSSRAPRPGMGTTALAASLTVLVAGVGIGLVAMRRHPGSKDSTVQASTVTPPPSPTREPAVVPDAAPPVVEDAPPMDSPSDWVTLAAPASPVLLGHVSPGEGLLGLSPQAQARFEGPGFRVMKREVTFGAYEPWARGHADREFLPAAWVPASPEARAGLPVVGVSWEQARAFCRAVGGELPSEAQWEFAARGPARRLNPWGAAALGQTSAIAAMHGGIPALNPVGSVPADCTPEGVCDLGGNAMEWVLDEYRTDDGERPDWTRGWHTLRGLSLLDDRAHGVPFAGLFRTPGSDATRGSAQDRAVLATVGFRCVKP